MNPSMIRLGVFICCLFLSSAGIHAQKFDENFKLGLGFGSPVTLSNSFSILSLLTAEPSYFLNENFAIGMRFEVARYSRSTTNGFEASTGEIGSYGLTGQYYFGKNWSLLRPFLGVGIGRFSLPSVSERTSATSYFSAPGETKFGFYSRAGVDLNRITISIDFNLISPTGITGTNDELINNYLSVRIGGFLFGRKRDKR